jgi:hypothetical protein
MSHKPHLLFWWFLFPHLNEETGTEMKLFYLCIVEQRGHCSKDFTFCRAKAAKFVYYRLSLRNTLSRNSSGIPTPSGMLEERKCSCLVWSGFKLDLRQTEREGEREYANV